MLRTWRGNWIGDEHLGYGYYGKRHMSIHYVFIYDLYSFTHLNFSHKSIIINYNGFSASVTGTNAVYYSSPHLPVLSDVHKQV